VSRRELFLLRHAKSSWDRHGEADFDRPLSSRGRNAAPRVGHWMRRHGLVPDHVISSPARRARETVQRVLKELALDEEAVVWEERVYEATLPTLLQVLAQVDGSVGSVLLVGHNPGLEELLEYLASDPPERDAAGKLLTTAALAHLALEAPWGELEKGSGHLVRLVRPRTLVEPGQN
jgi:phosphohistidine phosphatase